MTVDPVGLSRVELEPVMARAACLGDAAQVEAIRVELAARTWQHDNPYLAPAPPARDMPQEAGESDLSAEQGADG